MRLIGPARKSSRLGLDQRALNEVMVASINDHHPQGEVQP
jgi:hypothetical protein